jgi:ElaB/YqjD/DUF883 family membrane-anchored ribosome-binding protein
MDQTNNPQSMTLETTTNRTEPRNAESKLDTIKNTVADKLHSAASAVRQKAEGQGTGANYAGKAATFLDDAAGYVREADPQQIKTDIQNKVKNNPGRSLLVAGVAGLLLGALLRRR